MKDEKKIISQKLRLFRNIPYIVSIFCYFLYFIMIDKFSRKILSILHADCRTTIKEISERINLSQPSCAERLKKLVENGIIVKFSTQLSSAALGYPISAIVRIRPLPGEMSKVEHLIHEIKEIVQCDKVTGDDAFFCRMHLKTIEDLDACLKSISNFATTSTSIIKSSPISNRLLPLDGG